MAVSQADIDELNKAIAEGTRQVTIGGQSVTYQTTASLIQARNDLRAEMARDAAVAAGTTRKRQTTLIYGGRGYQ